MTHDRHGQLHAGTIGLFDDPDELAFSSARIEGQQAIAETKARKRAEKQRRKEEAAKKAKYEKPGLVQRFTSFLGLGKRTSHDGRVTQKLYEKEEEEEEQERMDARKIHDARRVDAMKRRDDEDQIYHDWQVDTDLDSPFYQELGMVRIKARHGMDVKIVHKSQIRSSNALADYGESSRSLKGG